MNKFNTLVEKVTKKDYEIYHDSYTAAIQAALKFATDNGYETDPEETADLIGLKSARPKQGKTEKVGIPLYKKGRPQKQYLQISVYNRGNDVGNNMELTTYIL